MTSMRMQLLCCVSLVVLCFVYWWGGGRSMNAKLKQKTTMGRAFTTLWQKPHQTPRTKTWKTHTMCFFAACHAAKHGPMHKTKTRDFEALDQKSSKKILRTLRGGKRTCCLIGAAAVVAVVVVAVVVAFAVAAVVAAVAVATAVVAVGSRSIASSLAVLYINVTVLVNALFTPALASSIRFRIGGLTITPRVPHHARLCAEDMLMIPLTSAFPVPDGGQACCRKHRQSSLAIEICWKLFLAWRGFREQCPYTHHICLDASTNETACTFLP